MFENEIKLINHSSPLIKLKLDFCDIGLQILMGEFMC